MAFNPFSSLKGRKYISVPEALITVLSALGVLTSDPAYHTVRSYWQSRIIQAIRTGVLPAIDNFPDSPLSANIPPESRYQIKNADDLEAWFQTETATAGNAGTIPFTNKKVKTSVYRLGADKTNKPYREAEEAAINLAKEIFNRETPSSKDEVIEKIGGILELEGHKLPSARQIWEYLKAAQKRKELIIPENIQKPARKPRKA